VTYNDPTDLRGQEAEKRQADARRRVVRENEVADIKWVMSSKKGRRLMWRWLGISGVFRLSFDQNAMRMAFNEGNRNLGLQLLTEVMDLCPEMFPVMEKEQREAPQRPGPVAGDPAE
jgi:hypothetical protein